MTGELDTFSLKAIPSILGEEVQAVQRSLLDTIQSTSSKMLAELGTYYAARPSKQMRPRLILLLAKATGSGYFFLNILIYFMTLSASASKDNQVSMKHTQLAQIVEMIHVASLLHDDVLDNAATRRGETSAPVKYGNKSTILTGDFLLAKLMSLAVSLESWEVAQEIPGIIGDLIEGEMRQAEGALKALRIDTFPIQILDHDVLWADYVQRIYLKTGTLFARSAKCSVLLHKNVSSDVVKAAYEYGRNLGIAFQIVDDILDFTGDDTLGKPHGNDIREGIITAPVLFAMKESPEIRALFARGFSQPNDIDKAICIIHSTQAIHRSEEVAMQYAKQAQDSISAWEPSPAKCALEELTRWITMRKH
ncbi:terpenoid synthase [Dendrothele bispora CBS 962.96]|uniref:(2E,6E)-farnesyl diphosphate synthase n=1 Tax=Dendrothele bispora (strain CBS 962.96) TaxID=1314807 RepID=A0A4S8MT09_DENBC|nr:terpenoid synthase [Dendrothele bispora CBS 962.96]